ncbi:unnamed protein product [Psylliodes chrysocephalus]|uniref:Uncharacterized protein n=1 Tax=Psylliodes chrysocephalus TaxID=3402493 RepID=A0A9P0CFX7_9CUCU|nr:unnamed protein product [Psylliodes chrysocephala]
MNDRNRRVDNLNGLVTSQPKATQRIRNGGKKRRHRALSYVYHLKINGELQKICQHCFKKTFDVTDRFLKYMLSSRENNIAIISTPDQRDAHAPPSKISEQRKNEVIGHINSFPRNKSHYTRRHTDKEYLAANLNRASWYWTNAALKHMPQRVWPTIVYHPYQGSTCRRSTVYERAAKFT